MSEALPTVTVVIAARPTQAEVEAVKAAKQLVYPREKLEILVARGKQPSVQRNTAIRAAHGELIYFLDDDSTPRPENLATAARAFADSQVKMLGGPNLCPTDAPLIEQVFALVHGSWLAFFSSRARYASVGKPRATSEKELILCNLVARRDAMLELGGFNEALYPNEENALMDELLKRGGKLLYDPDFVVCRRPRGNLKAFSKMLLNYGRGRAEQFRLHPTAGSAPNFVPPLFLAYCLLMLVLPVVHGLEKWRLPLLAPLGLYAAALLVQAVILIPRGGIVRSVCAIPLIALTHLLYGAGFWRGLFTPLKARGERQKVDVHLESVEF